MSNPTSKKMAPKQLQYPVQDNICGSVGAQESTTTDVVNRDRIRKLRKATDTMKTIVMVKEGTADNLISRYYCHDTGEISDSKEGQRIHNASHPANAISTQRACEQS